MSLRQEIRGKVIGWDDKKQDKNLFDIKAYIPEAESLWISGQNMSNLLPEIMEDLVGAVKEGLKVKLLTLNKDGNDPVLNLIANAQKSRGTEEKSIVVGTQKAFKVIEEILEALQQQPKIKGEFIHKTLKWNPNCGIILIRGKDKTFAKAKVAFYGPSEYRPKPVSAKRLRIIVDQSIDPDLFRYYENHFSWLWEHLSNEQVSIPYH